jgi:rhodanese-related sulfurtransferase
MRTADDPADIVVITGLSGAGRSTAAKSLEDLGWFVVDNLPPGLLPTMVDLAARSNGAVSRMAAVVDVRSRAELDFVGRVPGSVEIEWKRYPGMALNAEFVQQLTKRVPQDATVMFLCRSGGRSHETAAAAAQAGYTKAYNVLQGFEGDRDASGHRNTIGGWRAAGLPWLQS